jgi:hypothetical protein
MTALKAYQVTDGGDGNCIRFATNNATARREGANEIGCDWREVESCRRRPEFDAYAPGPIPPAVMIANNWGFECMNSGCWNWVYSDLDEKRFSIAGDPYCCEACMAQHFAKQRGQAAAEAAIQELVELRLPGAKVTEVYVHGQRLEPHVQGCGYSAFADFTFAGSHWPGRFVFGEDFYRVHADDHPAFHAAFPKGGA